MHVAAEDQSTYLNIVIYLHGVYLYRKLMELYINGTEILTKSESIL